MKLLQKINLNNLAFLLFLLFIFLFPFLVFAQNDTAKNLLNNTAEKAGYEKETGVVDIVSAGINGFFALIGVIFLIYIIYAGYLWLSAQGEEQVKKAKEQIRNAVLGLIIIVSSYAIVSFILRVLFSAGGGRGGGLTGSP